MLPSDVTPTAKYAAAFRSSSVNGVGLVMAPLPVRCLPGRLASMALRTAHACPSQRLPPVRNRRSTHRPRRRDHRVSRRKDARACRWLPTPPRRQCGFRCQGGRKFACAGPRSSRERALRSCLGTERQMRSRTRFHRCVRRVAAARSGCIAPASRYRRRPARRQRTGRMRRGMGRLWPPALRQPGLPRPQARRFEVQTPEASLRTRQVPVQRSCSSCTAAPSFVGLPPGPPHWRRHRRRCHSRPTAQSIQLAFR